MKNFLEKLDKLVCDYLGLNTAETTPHFVVAKDKQLIVLNTESFKRHAHKTPLSKINIAALNKENKEKLGIAVGKAIATNLVVSFEEISIKRENLHAG